MRRTLFTIVLLAVLSGAGSAQRYIAHPIDALHNASGDSLQLGASYPVWDEGRSQNLIPARYLPPHPCEVLGFAVSCHRSFAGSLQYKGLTISAGHTARSTLSTTFATNLPNPAVVYAASPVTVTYAPGGVWTTLLFSTPFRYDGKSNLVIEIKKIVDRARTSTFVYHQEIGWRPDLPQNVANWGPVGSGASMAPTAKYNNLPTTLLKRLRIRGAPSLTVWSPYIAYSAPFKIGSSATFTTWGDPGAAFVDAYDVGTRTTPLTIPGITGGYWLPTLVNVMAVGRISAAGRGDVTVKIPPVQALVGRHLYFQSATLGAANIMLTNVVDAIIAR